jgi:hypothetical protein
MQDIHQWFACRNDVHLGCDIDNWIETFEEEFARNMVRHVPASQVVRRYDLIRIRPEHPGSSDQRRHGVVAEEPMQDRVPSLVKFLSDRC